MNNKIKIIAEIGENHIGNVGRAKNLIEKAAAAGADYVKFQSYRPETFRSDDPEYGWFKKVYLSDEAHFMLRDYAEKLKIKFLSSPLSVERAQFLCEKMGLEEIKIASGVMLNFSILDYLNEHAETVFLSTGMATIAEIKKALAHLDKIRNLYVLHCVSQYPCRDEEVNLRAIMTLKKEFNLPIGYSDHTFGEEACLAAVTLGAAVIEKHFTFNRNCRVGTDHGISLEPAELKAMVQSIRRIEVMFGHGRKMPGPGEKKIIDFVRKRFV